MFYKNFVLHFYFFFFSNLIRTLRSLDGSQTCGWPIGQSEWLTSACCCNLFENSSEHYDCWQRWLANQKCITEISAKRVNSLFVLEVVAEVVLPNDFISTQQNVVELSDSDAAHRNQFLHLLMEEKTLELHAELSLCLVLLHGQRKVVRLQASAWGQRSESVGGVLGQLCIVIGVRPRLAPPSMQLPHSTTRDPTTLLCSSILMFQRWDRERRCADGEDLAWSLNLSAASRKRSKKSVISLKLLEHWRSRPACFQKPPPQPPWEPSPDPARPRGSAQLLLCSSKCLPSSFYSTASSSPALIFSPVGVPNPKRSRGEEGSLVWTSDQKINSEIWGERQHFIRRKNCFLFLAEWWFI